ncbi:zinc finger protein 862-like [Mercenaria mercenaria]|uniref:zinc finger protein 862-like n=1 Tax=Mercenaria mercenaria TaxID=6596 RepID=UPI00234FB5AE|nr:zinc finger protein 862-like [Mercenaria mercenaria]
MASQIRTGEGRQVSIADMFGISAKSPTKTNTTDKEIDQNNNVDPNNSSTTSRKRKFLPEWLDKFYWLRLDKVKNEMFCATCSQINKSNPFTSGCTNFQMSTLTRHQYSKDHSDSVKKLKLQSDFKKSLSNSTNKFNEIFDKSEENLVKQLRTVYVMPKRNLPGDVFSSLMELQQLNGVEIDTYYTKPEIVSEMECSIYNVIEDNMLNDIKSSEFMGIMLDETCDISIEKKLVIYIRYIKDGKIRVSYAGNQRVTDCTAEGIKTALVDFLRSKGLMVDDDLLKIMGLGTDGAAVMVGCRNSVGMKLKEYNRMMTQVHCVAHRLNLAASQAGKGIQYMEEYRTYIQTLYRFYADSSVRYDKLKDLQQMLHGKVKQVPEGTSVRWLSLEAAVKMIYEYFDSIVMSLESDIDLTGKAAGIYRFVGSAMFLLCTALLIDILTVIGILNLTFQKDHINLSNIRKNVQTTLNSLEGMNITSETVSKTLDDLGGLPVNGEKSRYKNVDICDNQQIRERFSTVREKFINNLKDNINARFPEDHLNILESLDIVFNPKR